PRRGRSFRARTEDGLHFRDPSSSSHPRPGHASRAIRPAPPGGWASAAGRTPSQACWFPDRPCCIPLVLETVYLVRRHRRAGPLHRAAVGTTTPPHPAHVVMVKGIALPFLERSAVFYAILAGVRNCPGVTPMRRLKWRENWLWSEKPACAATSASDRSVP